MLGKLLKHEFKATGRVFLPLYLALVVMSVIASFTLRSDIGIVNALTGFLMFALYVALIIVTIVLLVQRFYQGLLRNEGYLMFTLPVTSRLLVASKLITACVWCIFSMIVGAVAGLIASSGFFRIGEFFELIGTLKESWMHVSIEWSLVVLAVAACIVSLAFSIMQVYFSLAVGQLPVFGGHRIIFAILVYIATSIVVQITAFAAAAAAMPYFEDRYPTLKALSDATDPAPYFAQKGFAIDLTGNVMSAMNTFTFAALVFCLVFTVVLFLGTSWILKRKLNLE